MKKLLILVILMTAGFNANADALAEQATAAQNLVQVGTPSHNGLKFLALTGAEKYHEQENRILARAEKICQWMGFETVAAVSTEDIQYSSQTLAVIQQNVITEALVKTVETRENYWDPSLITNLVCKTK